MARYPLKSIQLSELGSGVEPHYFSFGLHSPFTIGVGRARRQEHEGGGDSEEMGGINRNSDNTVHVEMSIQ